MQSGNLEINWCISQWCKFDNSAQYMDTNFVQIMHLLANRTEIEIILSMLKKYKMGYLWSLQFIDSSK